MKRILNIALLFTGLLFVCSCNDDFVKEVYSQMVSFKAPTGSEGVYDVYMRFHSSGLDTLDMPLIVSGTTDNSQDLTVRIGVDNDTLAQLNESKYLTRTDLFYRQLDESQYSFPSTCSIKKGENYGLLHVYFDLQGIDMVDKWVLPLNIEDDPSYTVNRYLGRGKALVNINLFNDFSGHYASQGVSVKIKGSDSQGASTDTRTAKVVDDSTVFIYAGIVPEEDIDRAIYKMKIHFEPGTVDENGETNGVLTLSTENSNKMHLFATAQNTYNIKSVKDANQPYLVRYYVTLYLNYSYQDVTSNPNQPITYECTGSMTMERKINTLIPDRDQAIEW